MAADFVLTIFESTFLISVVAILAGWILSRSRPCVILVLPFGIWICYAMIWLWCLIVVVTMWGMLATIVGLALGIVGVVPVTLVLLIFSGQWNLVVSVILMLIATTFLRIAQHYLKRRAIQLAMRELGDAGTISTSGAKLNGKEFTQGLGTGFTRFHNRPAAESFQGRRDKTLAGVDKIWEAATEAEQKDPKIEVPY